MKKGKRNFLIVILVLVVAFGLLGFNTFSNVRWSPDQAKNNGGNSEGKVPCINPALPIPSQYHIHPHLRIIADGKDIPVPSNIGISLTCERVLHTHDQTGAIHIEPNFYQEFTLGDFFGVWGKPFSKDQILDYHADADHSVTVLVDGKLDEEYENLRLRDKQDIVIYYQEAAKLQ